MRPLEGRIAIVTGAGQPVSLGRSHALALADAGAKVIVNDNGSAPDGSGADTTLAEIVAREIRERGGEAVASTDSVATSEGAEAIVATALDAFGRVDILVNNAGNQRMALIWEASDEDFDSLIAVHLRGTFLMTRAVAKPMMAQASGVIVNTASTAGLGMYGNAIYAAAKEGVIGFTRSVARDLGPHGIRCNAIRPGAVSRMRADPRAAELAREAEEEHGFPCAWNQFLVRDMIQSVQDAPATDLDPGHVANIVVWLCSDAADAFNGRSFRTAGGELALMTDPDFERSLFLAGGWTYESLCAPQVSAYFTRGIANRFRGVSA
ncbi:SDR family NAD(P)-dependent oxidoreductase [Sphingomonas sp. CGMCC 1.13654]|uniref:SDR family NAD(P)-dependent oxidoreductase n=1 Tax=Sphingomonas chungangi TaxID=2683589 RepID=A0A838L5P1_9SPHN|nr:SDR family NAD(P)-dependent oxidoreductase [Sphingomonas chungangi]